LASGRPEGGKKATYIRTWLKRCNEVHLISPQFSGPAAA
jgi:hypothetical protein